MVRRRYRVTSRMPSAASSLLATALLSAAGCAGRSDGAVDRTSSRLGSGDHEIRIRHDGRARAALVHVPPGARDAPLPIVLAFHGGGGEANGFKGYADLDRIADREGFIAVFPFGTGVLPRRLLTWNAGVGCCGYALANRVDDVGFAMALVDSIALRIRIDPRRIYATGHSNGAIMAYRLAAERSDRIAAIVPVAGALDVASFAPARPVAVLHIHSTDDPRALYPGGLGPAFPGTDHRVEHRPVEAGLAQWRRRNGCVDQATVSDRRTGAPGSANAGQTATRLVWACANGGAVEHWKLTGVGHGWPGRTDLGLREELIGRATTLLDAAEEIWSFVSRFHR